MKDSGTCIVTVKYDEYWNDDGDFTGFSWKLIDLQEITDYGGFVEFLEEETDILARVEAFRMFIELISDCNIAKYIHFDKDEDYAYLIECMNAQSLSCAIVIEYGQREAVVEEGTDMEIDDIPSVLDPRSPENIGEYDEMDVDGPTGNSSPIIHNIQYSPTLPTITEEDEGYQEDEIRYDGGSKVYGVNVVKGNNMHEPDGVYIPDEYRYVDRLDLRDYRTNFNVLINNIYASKKLLKQAVKVVALKNNFQISVVRSNASRVYIACLHDECGWHLRASRFKMSSGFIVHTLYETHSCPRDFVRNDHRQATSDIVAEFIKQFYPPVDGKIMKSYDLIEMMRCNHGISISYAKAQAAREIVFDEIRGSPEASFTHLTRFLHEAAARNPGSYIRYEHDEDFRFKYLFMALEVSIKGFEHCRPVLSVDGTFLKNKYGGTILAAVSMDANNHIFPICVAIVDSENDISWEWFFVNLKEALGEEDRRLAIISDRHGSIKKAVEKVFPRADYGFCMFHLSNNIKSRFRKKGISDIFKRAACSFSIEEFEHHKDEMYRMEPRLEGYLEGVGLSRWARAYFDGLRFNIMTTNISESFNNAMTPYRELPLISFMEEVLLKLQKWFVSRRAAVARSSHTLSDWASHEIGIRINIGRRLKVLPSGFANFMVSDQENDFFVDCGKRECSCRQWQLEMFPCPHACAALSYANIPVLTYVDYYYSKDALQRTYEGAVSPAGRKNSWPVINDVLFIHMLPPNSRRAAGRPKKRRFRSRGELKKILKCGRCNGSGHNRKSCQNPLSMVPFSGRGGQE